MRDAPVDVADDCGGAGKGGGEGEGGAFVIALSLLHSPSFSPTKAVDVLVWIANTDKSTFSKPRKQGVVNRREVLVLVNEGNWKTWKCSSKQRGHVYLIVIIDKPFVACLNRAREDFVNE